MDPKVVARGEDWVAVDKPSGWLVHRAAEMDAPDLVAWLADQGPPVRPLHRLDKGTSGLVLFATSLEASKRLAQPFQRHEVGKAYLALVFGRTRRKGIIRRALHDDRRGRSLDATTRYRTVAWLGAFSLVRARPETGRKHQLRRHLHGLGHPVVGDVRYRPKRFRAVPRFPGRLWLHAAQMDHPEIGTLEAALAPELDEHLAYLRGRVSPQ